MILRSSLPVRKGQAAPATGTSSDYLMDSEQVTRTPEILTPKSSEPASKVAVPKVHGVRLSAPTRPGQTMSDSDMEGISPQAVNAVRAVIKSKQTVESPVKAGPCGGSAQAPRKARPGSARPSLSVRLDQERHLHLSVYSALTHCTKQDILIQALDVYLEQA